MKKGFRILKFKKDKPIFEVKNVSRPTMRAYLKTVILKVFLASAWVYWVLMGVVKQLYFQYV